MFIGTFLLLVCYSNGKKFVSLQSETKFNLTEYAKKESRQQGERNGTFEGKKAVKRECVVVFGLLQRRAKGI